MIFVERKKKTRSNPRALVHGLLFAKKIFMYRSCYVNLRNFFKSKLCAGLRASVSNYVGPNLVTAPFFFFFVDHSNALPDYSTIFFTAEKQA